MFTEEQDALILDQVKELGHKWKMIAKHPSLHCSPNIIKNRYSFLRGWEKLEKALSRTLLPDIQNVLMKTDGIFDYVEQPLEDMVPSFIRFSGTYSSNSLETR